MRRPFPIGVVTAAALPVDTFDAKLERIAGPLRALDASGVARTFALRPDDRLLKTTLSLCAECLSHVPAAIFARGGAVLLAKRCAVHGAQLAVVENDERYYHLSSKDRWGRCFAPERIVDVPPFAGEGCCGPGTDCAPASAPGAWPEDFSDQRANKTCTVLVEITDACNLACRVCYSDSKGDRVLGFDQFRAAIERLLAVKGRLDSVQITGGEASLHPRFFDMIAYLHGLDAVAKIYLPTNGIELAKPRAAERLAPFRDKVIVLLQFDGAFAETNRTLRRARPERVRAAVIRALSRLDVPMQLTMTLARGISEREIAWVVAQGRRHRNVRLVALLPAMFSGRHEIPLDPLDRLTLSDVVKGVTAGLGSGARESDFMPIPCSHPNCGWATLFARRFGLFVNLARHIDLDAVMDKVAYKTQLGGGEMQAIVGTGRANPVLRILARVARRLIRPRDVFGIVCKPFMDRFSYDQDRVSNCCHHVLDTHGRLESFCEYNARHRAQDSWARLPRLEEHRPAESADAV